MHFSPKTAPNVPISLAVRAAMSTQGVYPPVWISGNYYADSRLLYNYPIEIFEIPAVVDPIAGTAMGMRAVRNIFSNDATTSTIVSIDYDEHKKPSAVPTASKLSSAAVSLLQDLQGPQILSDVERRYTVNVSFPTINPFDFEETNRLLPAARAACVDAIKLFCGSQSGYGGYPAGTVTASRR
jgi:predicted acylesterase/phospholipase RssA